MVRTREVREAVKTTKHFFKILVNDFSNSLRIPPNFFNHLQGEMKNAIIEGPNGKKWNVKLAKTNEGLFFTFGWSKFVKDHSLELHDLLIFRYNGSMQFTVLQIFDKSACEKHVHENEERQTSRSGPRKLLDDVVHIIPHSSEDNSNEDNDEEMTSEEISKSKGKKIASGRRLSRRLSRRRPVTEREKKRARNAAHSFTSNNPFCIIGMQPSHVYRWSSLRFPMMFSKKFLPRNRCIFTLRISNKKVWDATYLPYLTERDILSKGWSVFVQNNDLEEDDFCVFELVKPTVLQVHIFRVVEVSRATKN